jgi:predicted permease
MRLLVEPAATGVSTELRSRLLRPVLLLIGIAGVLLLIMCFNLANLTAARTAARAQEMSLRLALGAGVWQIVRQLLTEGLLLAAAGAAGAVVVAQWGSRYLLTLIGADAAMPVVLDLRPDWHVFAFTGALAALAGISIGIAPVLQVCHQSPGAVLRRSRGLMGRETRSLRRMLVVAQIALSFVLLQCAGLFLRTVESLRALHPGFARAGLIEASLYGRPGGYANANLSSYRRQLIEDVSALPGVRAVAFSNVPIPAGQEGWSESVSLVGGESNGGGDLLATLIVVSPGYFKTLGVTPTQGRDFEWSDNSQRPPVAIVDAEAARRLMLRPNGGGYRIRFGVQPEFQNLQVVGVAPSMALIDSREPRSPVIYVPFLQHLNFSTNGVLLLRQEHPGAAAHTVNHVVQSLGVEYAPRVDAVLELSERALARERVIALLSTFSAGGALLLAGIGLFGTMSYTVARRTREIGIRMALGSQRAAIRHLILRESLVLALTGIGVGLVCSFAVRPVVAHLVFRLPPADPATLAMAAAAVVAGSMLAAYLPARRAMQIDVSIALKCE